MLHCRMQAVNREREKHMNINFCSGEGRVDPGTAGRITGQEQFMCSPPSLQKVNVFFRLTGWLSQGQPPFRQVSENCKVLVFL